MFYLMTFDYPFLVTSNKQFIRKDNYIDPDIYNERLIDIIMSMLEEDPNKRPSCQDVYQQMANLIGSYYMNINYKIKNNDIKLENNYMAKKTAFFSIILSFYNIEDLKNYFKLETVKKKIRESKKDINKKDSIAIIDNFREILSDFESTEKRFNNIKKFILKISEKILLFKDYNRNITPKIIIRTLFNYFYYFFYFNGNDLFVYNNNNAFIINEIIREQKEKKKDISPLIETKFVEFRDKYPNKFADIFYFLMLKKIICPNCNNIMEERVDFEYDIDFYNKGLIKELFVDYFKPHNYEYDNKNMKMCEKCYTMTSNFIEEKYLLNAPDVFIIHFNLKMDNMIENNIEINETMTNQIIKYKLFSIILKESVNDNYRYNISIFNDYLKSWKYIKDESSFTQSINGSNSVILSSDELIGKINQNEYICTAFYKKE